MVELELIEIRVSTGDSPPLVVMAETSGAGRRLPIWVSHSGAAAIFSATEDSDAARPAIHDLMAELLSAGDDPLTSVEITGFDDGQFFADLVFQTRRVPARPSDAIAVALRSGCPIRCSEALMDEVGVSVDPAPQHLVSGNAEEQVQRFLQFLDEVKPEDFTGGEQQP